jgi:hypothetical protein
MKSESRLYQRTHLVGWIAATALCIPTSMAFLSYVFLLYIVISNHAEIGNIFLVLLPFIFFAIPFFSTIIFQKVDRHKLNHISAIILYSPSLFVLGRFSVSPSFGYFDMSPSIFWSSVGASTFVLTAFVSVCHLIALTQKKGAL